MFQDWENIQELSPKDAAVIIFETFQKCRQNDEQDSMLLYAEHMVEVGQYLKRKLADRCRRCQQNFVNIVIIFEISLTVLNKLTMMNIIIFLCEGLKRMVARRAM